MSKYKPNHVLLGDVTITSYFKNFIGEKNIRLKNLNFFIRI